MPPKVAFSQESVVSAGLEIVREGGFALLSARTIAARLKSSTAPVYTSFASMGELRTAIIAKAEGLLNDYALRPYTKSVFLNMGTGIALFALENPVLFRSLFMDITVAAGTFENLRRTVASHLDEDELASRLTPAERLDVLHKLSIFVYGYASMICVGIVDVDKKAITKVMLEMGRDVIESALRRCSSDGGGSAPP